MYPMYSDMVQIQARQRRWKKLSLKVEKMGRIGKGRLLRGRKSGDSRAGDDGGFCAGV